jgi:hypothetical protein
LFFLLERHLNSDVILNLIILMAIPAAIIRLLGGVVGIATVYGLDDRGVGVRVPVGSRIFSSPSCPDRLWGPPNLLPNEYRGFFPRGKAGGRGVKLTTHLKLLPRSRKCGSIHHSPIRLRGLAQGQLYLTFTLFFHSAYEFINFKPL